MAVVEQAPRMEGRLMFMILAPNPKVAQRARELARQAAASPSPKKPTGDAKPAASSAPPAGEQEEAQSAAP